MRNHALLVVMRSEQQLENGQKAIQILSMDFVSSMSHYVTLAVMKFNNSWGMVFDSSMGHHAPHAVTEV